MARLDTDEIFMPAPTDTPATATPPGDLIRQLRLKPGHAAIVGLQWGDEGKGKVVDMLAAAYDVVARYNGGANAGHTVVVGDQKYALHLIPSGVLYPDKANVLGNGVVIDPAQLVKEITGLQKRGVKVDPTSMFISNRAHVVMPYHKVEDRLLEETSLNPIGTTGRGIGPCYADKAIRLNAIRMGDLTDDARLKQRIREVVAFKNVMLMALADAHGKAFEPIRSGDLIDQTREHMQVLGPMVTDTAALLHEATDAGRDVLFEGANATLLDIDHGTYPYVTSSNCSSLGVHTGTGVPGHQVPNVIGIAKAYQTRVGEGPMPTELTDDIGERIRQVGREYGTTTGRPRRCGWIDLVALKYTARVSGATALCVMLLDVLADLPELKLCNGYRIDGEVTDRFPSDAVSLAKAEPVLKTLPGFAGPIDHCRTIADLPEGAQAYLRYIESFLGVPVVLASVGPKRSETALIAG
ncbi:MAG: adenylosuccinate synthase [Planctomycetota bacterium]